MIADTSQITPVVAAEVLWFYEEDGGQPPNSFHRLLIALIKAADGPNRHKLRQQWPEYVAAVEEIQTPGSGAEALRVIAEKLQEDSPAAEPLIDPDCRDGKCGSCVGGPCEHECHQAGGVQ